MINDLVLNVSSTEVGTISSPALLSSRPFLYSSSREDFNNARFE